MSGAAPQPAAALRAYAEERVGGADLEGCVLVTRVAACERCGGSALGVRVDRRLGDERGDFHGEIHVTCAECGDAWSVLSVRQYGDEGPPVAVETPRCECGSDTFSVALCDRYEDWGYFDEGAVAAQCALCGALRVLADTD